MHQYLLSVHHTDTEPMGTGAEPDEILADVAAFNDDLARKDLLVFAGGLQPASAAVVVDATRVEAVNAEGTYLDGDMQLGGFWVIQADRLEDALAWAERGSRACRLPIEVRAFHDEPEGVETV